MRLSRAMGAVAAATAFAFAAAGCGDDDEREGDVNVETAPATDTSTTGTETGTEPAGPPVATVRISGTDFKLKPANPKVEETGNVEFEFKNDGQTVHALEVEGPTGEVETEEIDPGQSAELTADLSEPGTYTMYCPVGNHEDLGMVGEITVAGG